METEDLNALAEGFIKAEKVFRRVGRQLLALPHVVEAGCGRELREGKTTGRVAIVVTVREKLSLQEMAQKRVEPLPEEFDGVPVDVVAHRSSPRGASVLDEQQAAVEKAIRIKDQVAAEWLKKENIRGIGVGCKVRGGVRTEQVSIRIYVAEKLGIEELERRKLPAAPSEIEGVPTDVMVMRRAVPHFLTKPTGTRGQRVDPLVGGVSVSCISKPFFYGTLGGIVFDSTGTAMGISNEHVLDGSIGETVNQPGFPLAELLDVDWQFDLCQGGLHWRVVTPNTTVGTVLAGSAVAAALLAGLSDDIDPTRQGQDNTDPPDGAQTVEEYTKVHLDYHGFPVPGTPFAMNVKADYVRRTNQGEVGYSFEEVRKNPHVLRYHRLFTDAQKYDPGEVVSLFGAVLAPQGRQRPCQAYHCVAILQPEQSEKTYSVILRIPGRAENDDILRRYFKLIESLNLSAEEIKMLTTDEPCIFYGEFRPGDAPLGHWRHAMHVQTVNTVPPGTEPLQAAPIIGGIPLSNHFTSEADFACGPFIYKEDGEFDIEVLPPSYPH